MSCKNNLVILINDEDKRTLELSITTSKYFRSHFRNNNFENKTSSICVPNGYSAKLWRNDINDTNNGQDDNSYMIIQGTGTIVKIYDANDPFFSGGNGVNAVTIAPVTTKYNVSSSYIYVLTSKDKTLQLPIPKGCCERGMDYWELNGIGLNDKLISITSTGGDIQAFSEKNYKGTSIGLEQLTGAGASSLKIFANLMQGFSTVPLNSSIFCDHDGRAYKKVSNNIYKADPQNTNNSLSVVDCSSATEININNININPLSGYSVSNTSFFCKDSNDPNNPYPLNAPAYVKTSDNTYAYYNTVRLAQSYDSNYLLTAPFIDCSNLKNTGPIHYNLKNGDTFTCSGDPTPYIYNKSTDKYTLSPSTNLTYSDIDCTNLNKDTSTELPTTFENVTQYNSFECTDNVGSIFFKESPIRYRGYTSPEIARSYDSNVYVNPIPKINNCKNTIPVYGGNLTKNKNNLQQGTLPNFNNWCSLSSNLWACTNKMPKKKIAFDEDSVSSWDECYNMCASNNKCKSFHYTLNSNNNPPSNLPGGGRCYLMNNYVENGNIGSDTDINNNNFIGNLYDTKDNYKFNVIQAKPKFKPLSLSSNVVISKETKNRESCINACSKEPKCQAIYYNSTSDASNSCYLLNFTSNIPGSSNDFFATVISKDTPIACEQNTTYLYGADGILRKSTNNNDISLSYNINGQPVKPLINLGNECTKYNITKNKQTAPNLSSSYKCTDQQLYVANNNGLTNYLNPIIASTYNIPTTNAESSSTCKPNMANFKRVNTPNCFNLNNMECLSSTKPVGINPQIVQSNTTWSNCINTCEKNNNCSAAYFNYQNNTCTSFQKTIPPQSSNGTSNDLFAVNMSNKSILCSSNYMYYAASGMLTKYGNLSQAYSWDFNSPYTPSSQTCTKLLGNSANITTKNEFNCSNIFMDCKQNSKPDTRQGYTKAPTSWQDCMDTCANNPDCVAAHFVADRKQCNAALESTVSIPGIDSDLFAVNMKNKNISCNSNIYYYAENTRKLVKLANISEAYSWDFVNPIYPPTNQTCAKLVNNSANIVQNRGVNCDNNFICKTSSKTTMDVSGTVPKDVKSWNQCLSNCQYDPICAAAYMNIQNNIGKCYNLKNTQSQPGTNNDLFAYKKDLSTLQPSLVTMTNKKFIDAKSTFLGHGFTLEQCKDTCLKDNKCLGLKYNPNLISCETITKTSGSFPKTAYVKNDPSVYEVYYQPLQSFTIFEDINFTARSQVITLRNNVITVDPIYPASTTGQSLRVGDSNVIQIPFIIKSIKIPRGNILKMTYTNNSTANIYNAYNMSNISHKISGIKFLNMQP